MKNPNQLISIIIPVFNESESIEYLLDEVLNVMLSNKLNFEIIVVNDGSQDDTAIVLDELTIKILVRFLHLQFKDISGQASKHFYQTQ